MFVSINCALALNVPEFLKLAASGRLAGLLSRGYWSVFREQPPAGEIRSWITSLPALAAVLDVDELQTSAVLLEYRFPMYRDRADALLVAGSSEDLRCVVVELKAWSSVEPAGSYGFNVRVPPGFVREHPSYQAARYDLLLREFCRIAVPIKISSCGFLYNLAEASLNGATVLQCQTAHHPSRSPLFFSDTVPALRRFLIERLQPLGCTKGAVQTVAKAPMQQSATFIRYLRKHCLDSADGLATTTGLGLPPPGDQAEVLAAVEQFLTEKRKGTVLVRGSSGSGKSIVALNAVLRATVAGRTATAVYVNRVLREVLGAALDVPAEYKSLLEKGIIRPPGGISGRDTFELIVCDEAQRLSESDIRRITAAGRVTVFLFDEWQRLLAQEAGTEKVFRQSAHGAVTVLELGVPRRYRQGQSYLSWVIQLLEDPLKPPHQFTDDGEPPVTVVESLSELRDFLCARREAGHEVAIVASFTESNGRKSNRLRAGPPPIKWAMPGEKGEYGNFWVKGRSNALNQCASVYGCQGLESAYVGVIWGRDLAWRQSAWCIHDRHTITDDVGKPKLVDLVKTDPSLALTLLKNRYYVLLSRASRGSVVFCEDGETREFLKEYVRGSAGCKASVD